MKRYSFNINKDGGPLLYREEAEDGTYVEAEEALDKIKKLEHQLAAAQDALIFVTSDPLVVDTLKEFIDHREGKYRQMIDTLQDLLAESLVDQPGYDWRARADHQVRAAQKLLKQTGPGRPGPITE